MKKLMSKKQLGALVVALIIMAAGLAAWVAQLTTGLLATTNMGNVFCWGLLIGMFAFCVGFGAGGQLAASYIVLSKRPELQRFALPAQAVGLGGAIGASVAIIADLGSPENILAMLLHLNVVSPLAGHDGTDILHRLVGGGLGRVGPFMEVGACMDDRRRCRRRGPADHRGHAVCAA